MRPVLREPKALAWSYGEFLCSGIVYYSMQYEHADTESLDELDIDAIAFHYDEKCVLRTAWENGQDLKILVAYLEQHVPRD